MLKYRVILSLRRGAVHRTFIGKSCPETHMFRLFCLLVAAVLTVAGEAPVLAQSAGPPQPPPEVGQLSYFLGTFKCEGSTVPSPISPFGNIKRQIKRTIEGHSNLNGYWLNMRFSDEKTDENPKPLAGDWVMSYDRKDNRFLFFWFDNLGRW